MRRGKERRGGDEGMRDEDLRREISEKKRGVGVREEDIEERQENKRRRPLP